MENRDRIEELFRENAFKLERKPSSRAWSRLESKLDKRAARPKFTIYRGFGLMAASLALALMAYTVVFVGQKKESAKWAMNNLGVVPTEIEILSSESDSDYSNNMYAIVEYSKSYSPRAINFNEGEIGQKIMTKGESARQLHHISKEDSDERVELDSTNLN